ncbi:MAG: response regulator [Alphaproteobacteria bacterium]|nr:response regulator [Alphaproteobacteria bacterium]
MISSETSTFPAGGGAMGARMRMLDWAATPLGPSEAWPQSLKAVLRVMLTSRFAMWLAWGPELTFFCNDAYLPTTGLKRDWVLGARSDRVWAEIWPDIGPRIEHVLNTGEATWDEALPLYLERSGFSEETYHTFSYSPLADDTGANAGMLCVVAEVTDRVIGERQLASLRDLGSRLAATSTRAEAMRALEASLAAAPHDLPFALAYLNDSRTEQTELAAVHGVDRGAPVATQSIAIRGADAAWRDGHALENDAEVIPIVQQALGDFPLSHWQVAPSRALVVPMMGAEGGTPLGFLVAGLNPHRALDAGYRGFIALIAGQLAGAVARADEFERERARALALAQVDRAKTAFFSNISHEFRTPLTLILGPLEDLLAESAALPQEQTLRVEIAHRNGQRLLRLVNGLLDFSRIEAGRVEATYRPTDLGSYTAELASAFRSACERAGLQLSVDCPPLDEPVFVDQDMWEKVVLNLLSNAFKFTLDGGISITLRQTDGAAELVVADTGSGIPQTELPKLFERFYRVEGAKGRSAEGSGIGLALVRDLVRLHGGEVTAESEVGRGTTFRVRVPLGTAHLPADRVEGVPTAPPIATRALAFVDEALRWLPRGMTPPDGTDVIHDVERKGLAASIGGRRNGRVLLADDNADLRDYVRRLLEERGYEVETAADGAAALAATRARRPDLLLTDVMMPGLDGFELLALIRRDHALADVPVVLLSARAGEEAKIDGLAAGADDYLVKPFSARELLARVAATLEVARTRREAGAAVRASEARLRGVLEGMAEGFALLDPAFRIVEMNAEGLRLDGREPEGVINQTYWEAYPGSEDTELGRLYRRAMAGRAPVALEHRRVWHDGREAWLDMHAHPTEDGALAVFYRDVTDRRRARRALEELNENLERRVAEAVAEREVARDRLHEAQKLETIGQLTGGVAHDFNNLLTPIMSCLHLLRRRHADERSQRLIGAALESAERAKTLIQRLLAFARRQTLAPQPVDPATLVGGIRELIDYSVGSAVSVRIDVPAALPPALADPSQLELALLNLAVNARDAMESGGVLTIGAWAEDIGPEAATTLARGRYIRFQVTDTGDGMDESTLARAVEPFFSTKGVGKGTGLGLSMVHGLALQSGGAFRLSSRVGAGTTAALWLPVTEQVPAAAAPPEPDALPATRCAALLLVDDEELVRASTAALLRELGYDVVEAASAAEALGHVRTGFRPELLITDHMMPAMKGSQLAAEIRTHVPNMPVLIITGYSDLPDGERLGLDVLAKPFAFSDLAGRITDIIDSRSPATSLSRAQG